VDHSLVLIGGGLTPFSKEPYVTLSRHTAPPWDPYATPQYALRHVMYENTNVHEWIWWVRFSYV